MKDFFRTKRKLLVSFLSFTLLLPLLFTNKTFAAEVTDAPLLKSEGYLNFPAYYEDDHHLPNQVTHPDVVVMDEAWNGYRYWAIYTPNVSGISIYENPSIVASHDGVQWTTPDGLTNPIEPQPATVDYHNCDADMIYNPEMDAMMGYWNWADDRKGGVGAEIRLRISYDGIHWGIPITYDTETNTWTKPTTDAERQVVCGSTDYIPVVTSSDRYDMLSPTFVYDSFRDVFMMWSNNTGDVGYNNGQANFVELRYSDDGITWGEPVRVNNFLSTNEKGQQLAPWHQDVQYVPELKEFLCVSQCFSGRNPDGSVLHFTKSKDGLNWEQVGNKALLSPGQSGSWDDFQIYRSCFYYEPGNKTGNGTMRVWYSALQNNTQNHLVADLSGNKTLRAKDQDSRIWRIGYASNSYESIMKSLMNDSNYSVPALVAGKQLELISDTSDNTIYMGETTTIKTSFFPKNTSDQLVRFSSANTSVAIVDQQGVVTPVGTGTVRITGETQEGMTATIDLNVKPSRYSLIPQSTMIATATSEHASSSEGPASYVLDGNSATIWHTAYNPKVALPQTLTVSFGESKKVGKYVYTPRQIGTNGIVTQYELYAVLEDGTTTLVTSGNWKADYSDKVLSFDPIDATALQLKVIGGSGGFGTAAEINVYEYVAEGQESTYDEHSITGDGVKVVFDEATSAIRLYNVNGENELLMSKDSEIGYPVVNGQSVRDFTNHTCTVTTNENGVLGVSQKMTIISTSPSTGLTRTYTLEVSPDVADVVYAHTTYSTGKKSVNVSWFVGNEFTLENNSDTIWSYNGGGEGPSHHYDTVQKIDLNDTTAFVRENKQDANAASIPVADVYSANGGIIVGDASVTRREVHTPVQETDDSARVSVKWPGKTIAANTTIDAGESFVAVHRGDYFVGLRDYKNAMERIGMIMPSHEDIPDSSYDARWESWGWGFNWTVDLIIGKLDELEAAGVKQITVDDGWYASAGDWELSAEKFPNGISDVRRLTDAIHEHGMQAILWWRPCDGGGASSNLYRQHSEYFVKDANGNPVALTGAGGKNENLGYALCPGSDGAVAVQTGFVTRAINDWGFDGLKGDYVWGMPQCYNPAHNHAYPEESTQMQSKFYKASYEALKAIKPDAFNMLCNCGTPQDYYSLKYVTQIATADPTSVDQTRRRVKAYKALMGDYFPVTTDHNDIWYASTIGTGAVMIEKRAFSGADQKEYEKWLNIANEEQLHKGRFIGDLYSYGFDPYETYVVEKNGVMYYAFYRDGSKFTTSDYPEIELRGLDPDKIYRIVDYVNDKVVATNLPGDNARFTNKFSGSLLVKAVEIQTPDAPAIEDSNTRYINIDDRDGLLKYSGTWHDDLNSSFREGTARYTNQVGAAVEFTFTGTSIRWYGQNDTNFGTADVYLDGEHIKTVNVNGALTTNVKLFEATNLQAGEHTIKIVCKSGVIDTDYFAYIASVPVNYETMVVDAMDEALVYDGDWHDDLNDMFQGGTARYANTTGSSVTFTFIGNAIRWYGQHDTNFGLGQVYLDDELVDTVNVNGNMVVDQLVFERTNLDYGKHTIRIVCLSPVIDVDYFTYDH